MPYTAIHRHSPVSPRKVRLIADMIRGKNVNEAVAVLRFMPQRAARLVSKVVHSALANAVDQGVDDVETLYVSKICVDDGIRIKRWRPRARGSAAPILRRRSHITVELDVEE